MNNVNGGPAFSYTPYQAMASDGSTNFGYDGLGRMSSAGSTNYQNDAFDRQRSVGSTAIHYDGFSQTPAMETTGSTDKIYALDPFGLPKAVQNGSATPEYLTDDGHGNIANVTGNTQGVTCSVQYDPWGNPISGQGTGNPCQSGSTSGDVFYRSARRDPNTGNYQFGYLWHAPLLSVAPAALAELLVDQRSPMNDLQIERVLRQRPPEHALHWVEQQLEGRWAVVSAVPLYGGVSHATHAIKLRNPNGKASTVVLRRWARPGWQTSDPEFTAEHEAATLRLLEQVQAPAARLLGVDAAAEECDVPAVLQTLIAGKKPAPQPSELDGFARALAAAIITVHGLDTAAARALALPYKRYYEAERLRLPRWATRPPLERVAAEMGPDPSDQHVQPTKVVALADIDQLLPGLMVQVVMYSMKSESVPFVDNSSGAQLPRASKGGIALPEPSRLQLFHDVSLLAHLLPARRQYSARLVPEPATGSRASREGWSLNPLRMMIFSYDTWETAQIGARLRLQDKLDECLAVFPAGFNARLSTAGGYLVQAISLFDDALAAAAFLTDAPVARLLDAYKRNHKKPPDDQVPGDILHDRRFLTFHHLAATTGLNGQSLQSLLEQLIERHVLRRGFAFQCPSCRWADFYRLGTFGDEFECRQCNRQTRWQLKHAHHSEAPELFYGLDEVVYRVADTDGHAVLRALPWLSEGITSFMVAPGVDIDWPGDDKPWEFDSVLLLDGRIVLLEVKNATSVEQDQLQRYQSMAERLRADEVCFVSTRGWDGAATTRIERLRQTLSARYTKVKLANLDLDRLP